jgi:glucose-6-phosphate isomerase
VSIVELGKVLAGRIIPELEEKAEPQLMHDSSTNILIRRYRNFRRPLDGKQNQPHEPDTMKIP